MNKFLCIALCFWVIKTTLIAQTITGKVADEKLQPLEFANVVLLSLPDSAFVEGTISNQAGDFILATNGKKGVIRVSSVGYTTAYKVYNGGENIGTVQLNSDTQLLGEVIVKGDLPTTRMKGDALVTSVQNSVLSKAGTANDVLSKVPGIIKKKDSFEVFGKGAPLIYINGRQVRDQSELDQLNSEDIKNVEVISNPGARYDATVKAVVRIQTVRRKGDGFGFDVRSSYYQSENVDLIEQVNMNYRHDNLDVFGTLEYDRVAWAQRNQMGTTIFAPDTLWIQKNPHREDGVSHNLRGLLGVNYMIGENHSIGARYSITANPKQYNDHTTNSDVTANGKLYDRVESVSHVDYDNRPAHQLSAYYNGKIGQLDIDFNADYYTNENRSTSRTVENSQEMEDREVNTFSKIANKLTAARLILSYPVWGGTLSVGGEYSHTSRDDDYVNKENYTPTIYSTLKETDKNAFVEYTHAVPIGQLAVGVRYENIVFDYYEDGKHIDGQSRKFDNWFPSLSFSTQVGKVNAQLSYTAKTQRPSYSQLSNNLFYMNRFSMQTGTPTLKSTVIHDVSLSGTWKFLQLMMSYQRMNDPIIYWSELMENNTSVSVFRFVNLDKQSSFSSFISAMPKVGCWSPQISFGVTKQWLTVMSNGEKVKLDTPMLMGTFNNTFSLPKDFLLSLDFTWQGKGNTDNYYLDKDLYICGVSIRKSFLKDALSIEAKGSDLFHGLVYRGQIYVGNSYFFPNNSNDSREFVLILRYKFNTTRNKYKGTGAANDELRCL
ncbi:MAG: TonB-dependent receptor family protein [Bacteroides sp.]|nr:TonB-dependent receptor family protein [Bacteroides sp.]